MTPDSSLRIAVVTETWPPEVNGVAMTMARVVAGLRERGHALQLVRPRQDHEAPGTGRHGFEELLVRGMPIPRYAHLRMGLPAGRILAERWTRQQPDVVHIATEGPLGWSALRTATALGLPVTSDFRTNFHAYSGHYGLGWLHGSIAGYLRRFHNRTRCTMVPTETLRRSLAAEGYERLAVVARGVDTVRFSPAHRSTELRQTWGAAPTDPVVLCVGRLAPEKNLETLLLAFAAMRFENPATQLVFIGDGPMRAELQRRCPDAVFAGQRRGDDLAAHYASGDLLLFPSLTETFGNVTPEAMASGLAVLAYDYAAAAQLIRHGENGRLACFGDPAHFVAQAAALVADPQAASLLGLAARRTALGLAWDGIVGQVEAVMRQAIAAGRDSPRALAAAALDSAAAS